MKYGYARVSTIHQRKDGNSLEDQRNQLQQEGCDIIVEEQFTGARMDRPKFQRLCALLEEGDTLVVCKLDRFARTVLIATELSIRMTAQVTGISRSTVQWWVHEVNGTPPVVSGFGEMKMRFSFRACGNIKKPL
ncbi:MAG: recombinase family protein [Bianqueaceae bacterium]